MLHADPLPSSDKIVLQGGLSQTGRPARLVRVRDGKVSAIGPSHTDDAVAEDVHEDGSLCTKRSRSDRLAPDFVHRSMARRRKLAPGEVYTEPAPQLCGMCDKEFKRPCDLT